MLNIDAANSCTASYLLTYLLTYLLLFPCTAPVRTLARATVTPWPYVQVHGLAYPYPVFI